MSLTSTVVFVTEDGAETDLDLGHTSVLSALA